MGPFETFAALLTIAAGFAYVNHRWIRLPTSIGLMAMALTTSILLLLLDSTGLVALSPLATRILEGLHLEDTLLHGALGILLFAGALHVNLNDLRDEKVVVITLSVVGTLVSTFLIGSVAHFVLPLVGAHLSLGHCFLFGSLISPTDPIAVLGIMRKARVPRSLEIQIVGESLFNDGVGVVVFLTVLGVVSGGAELTTSGVVGLFLREAVGGALFGLATGYLAYWLIRSIDHYQTELLVTLSLVIGGYAVAEHLHISGPISAVVSGLLIGNQGRALGMSEVTRDHLDKFWSLMDEILNALLFVVVGFEVIRLQLDTRIVLAGILSIPIVLLARFTSVAAVLIALRSVAKSPRGAIAIHTWGGLRGGISVALALGLPAAFERTTVVAMTYLVVVFSILVQGLTLGRVTRRFFPHREGEADGPVTVHAARA